jgi:hypothetical protein
MQRQRRKWRWAWLAPLLFAFSSLGCGVEDGLIDGKLCDADAPKEQQCVRGYIPVQEADGKCYCRPLSNP